MSTYVPIEEDHAVPDGSVSLGRITVDQYATPDGTLHVRTFYDGDLPLSSVLGLLALGALDIYGRANRGESEGR